MASGSGGGRRTGWARIRPVLVGLLLLADAVVVAALGFSQKTGWLPPFIAFGAILVGLVWFEAWSLAHRRDDD
ncbi:MAG TPA: hypothetical protein VEB65_00155 [Solirubrobacterales bacterium]|nr:hypothetical protein [Solirubrobacterales bacterium]